MSVSSIAPLVPGAPGIYRAPANPIRALTDVRMDVCAFAGVAPRGPEHTAVAVESWAEYTRLFSGFDGPGRLPYAVASFFENGGDRAYIVRIVHRYFKSDGTPDDAANDAGTARGRFTGLSAAAGRRVWVRARNRGSWGTALRATLSFTARALAVAASDFFINRMRMPVGGGVGPGATLRLQLGGGAAVIRRVASVVEDWNPLDGSRQTWAWFDATTAVAALSAEIVEGRLAVDDGVNPTEVHDGIGLASNHSRWLATALAGDSDLLSPADDPDKAPGDPLATWIDSYIDPGVTLAPASTAPFTAVDDRYADIIPADFFDDDWVPGDEQPGTGIHSIVELPDVSLLAVPDLYSPGALSPVEVVVSAPLAGPEFAECVEPAPVPPQGAPAEDLTGLFLDPRQDLDQIAALQRRVTDLADALESFIVLLDVPPGLSQRRILYWRDKFDTAYAAAYHPWLNAARTDDRRGGLVRVNPSGAAAGIIAQREILFGVPYGPANYIAVGAVSVDDRVSPPRHDELHQQAINVYIPERDGIRLTAARTLSRDPLWRQLNVRRLVTMIRRVLERQMQWAVFEPNNHRLRFQVARMLEAYLRRLFRANAFTGATEAAAFFVKCDDVLNPLQAEQSGQLLAQVGIAPAEPLEFIVLDIARQGDTITTSEEA